MSLIQYTPFMVATLGLMYCIELRSVGRLCNLFCLSLQGLSLWRRKLQEKVSFFYSLQSDTEVCMCWILYCLSCSWHPNPWPPASLHRTVWERDQDYWTSVSQVAKCSLCYGLWCSSSRNNPTRCLLPMYSSMWESVSPMANNDHWSSNI